MQAPPLSDWQRYPVTTGIALGAVIMTLCSWNGMNLSRCVMDEQFWYGELWRPLSSCLLHGDIIHLVFNLYWLWIFGTFLEAVFNSQRYLLIVILLALGSSVAQYAFDHPGIGLSGVGYGLFGLLWVMSRKDRRFYYSLDDNLVKLFVFWFFLCIVLTLANKWNVGNVAHGSGAILGAMLGWAIAEKDKKRKIGYSLLLAFSMLVIFAAGSFGRPYVNFAGDGDRRARIRVFKLAEEGGQAFESKDYARAAELFSQAIAIEDSEAAFWYNLGLCYMKLGKNKEASHAFQHAVELKPNDLEYQSLYQGQLGRIPPNEAEKSDDKTP